MLGKTHKVGGAVAALGGFYLLKESGHLLTDVSPLLQLTVMYPFAIIGSFAPDFDQNMQANPAGLDPVSKGVAYGLHVFNKPAEKLEQATKTFHVKQGPMQKLIKMLACSHRSWQTHSIEVLAVALYFYIKLQSLPLTLNNVILLLVSSGFLLGFISHIFLDLLTMDGIPSITLSLLTGGKLKKIRLVPHTHFFGTGTKYEDFVRATLAVFALLLFIFLILNLTGLDKILADSLISLFKKLQV